MRARNQRPCLFLCFLSPSLVWTEFKLFCLHCLCSLSKGIAHFGILSLLSLQPQFPARAASLWVVSQTRSTFMDFSDLASSLTVPSSINQMLKWFSDVSCIPLIRPAHHLPLFTASLAPYPCSCSSPCPALVPSPRNKNISHWTCPVRTVDCT